VEGHVTVSCMLERMKIVSLEYWFGWVPISEHLETVGCSRTLSPKHVKLPKYNWHVQLFCYHWVFFGSVLLIFAYTVILFRCFSPRNLCRSGG